MLIRDCRAEDVEVLERVGPTGANRRHARKYGNHKAGRSAYLLAFEGDEILGFCELQWIGSPEVRETYPGCPEINGLTVFGPHQGKGIGTALVREAEERARRRGCPRIGLAVDDDNPRAAKLYTRLGYQPGLHYEGSYLHVDDSGTQHRIVEQLTYLLKEL
ncbi:GNAT family N-acetyltransferase [Flindersiella endophytica]